MQDIGFDGIGNVLGSDDNVVNKYFDVYFPRAVGLGLCSSAATDRADFVEDFSASHFHHCMSGHFKESSRIYA